MIGPISNKLLTYRLLTPIEDEREIGDAVRYASCC